MPAGMLRWAIRPPYFDKLSQEGLTLSLSKGEVRYTDLSM